ncbi:MAG: hypothetical protein QXO11_04320 [Thermoplasmata archaeon]
MFIYLFAPPKCQLSSTEPCLFPEAIKERNERESGEQGNLGEISYFGFSEGIEFGNIKVSHPFIYIG